MKKKIKDENLKTFSDLTNKSWVAEENTVIIGESASKIMKGQSETISVKDIYYGDPWQTFRIIIDNSDKVFLLKTSRELR